MNNEEAKQIISDIDKAYRNFTADEYEALNMAIKSLEQETMPIDGDCISRKAVLSLLADHFDNVFDMIRELPPVAISLAEPCEDAISRQAVLDLVADYDLSMGQVVRGIHALPPVKPQELKYCDRNICLRNEYNNIGCDECEVTKSQEPSGDLISRQDAIKAIEEKAKRIKNEDTLNGLAGAVGILFDLPSVKPQICEDAISRQAVIDAIYDMEILKYRIDLENVIKALPSVKQEPTGIWVEIDEEPHEVLEQTTWIPCSERLPETDNGNSINNYNVLLWVKNKSHPEREPQIYLGKLRHIDGDDGSGNFWGTETKPCDWVIWGWSYFNEPEVIAWMPLPEPYKAESEDKE